jgi:hypothetical protein
MSPLELALKYMDLFFTGKNLEELLHFLADDLRFRGPFYEFDTAEAYVSALASDPPEGFEYEVLASFECGSSACLFYQFSKPGISVPMAQLFEVRDGKISRILLIFDTEAFT